MNITQNTILKTIDGQLIKYLNNAYTNDVPINKSFLCKEVAKEISSNSFNNSLPSLIIDFNKGGGVSRPVPVFTPKDYFVYYYCLKKLENKLAINRVPGTYGGWSLDGLSRRMETAESFESTESSLPGLNPAAAASIYGEFNTRIKNCLDNSPDNVTILEIDIANFYDNIRLDLLQRRIRATSCKTQLPITDLLFYFLSNCNKLLDSYRPKTVGIPQDMVGDCSRILANFYLQDYDCKIKKFCDKLGVIYLRFADDQIFILPNSVSPTKIAREASKNLYCIGLNINQKKVKVWEKSRFYYYRCFDIFRLLDPSKSNSDQTPQGCNAFAETSINVIRKQKMCTSGSYDIKSSGLPLIKKIIGLNIIKLTDSNRKKVLKLIFQGNEFLKYFAEYNFTKLYIALNNREKLRLVNQIDQISTHEIHASFDYEIMKFKRKNKLNWKNHGIKVNKITSEWRFS